MSSLIRNLRYTVRTLWKNPGLTLTVLLTLALGIGANTAIFTVDYATLLSPLPYPHPEQLVVVWSKIQTVGVYHNVRGGGLRNDRPEMEIPFWQTPWSGAGIGVRTVGDPAAMVKSVEAAVHSVDPEIALAEPRSMEEVRDLVLSNDRFTLILFVSFAVVALLLAALGVYGVMSFSVAQRSHEIALRMALGATRHRVVALIVREGLALACIGLLLGLIGAYFVGRGMQSTLYGVGKFDLSVFASVALVMLVAAVIACFIPARRAASVQPMQALRAE
jgi:putative ABC transport system permease protein